jgi:hypothetical protein
MQADSRNSQRKPSNARPTLIYLGAIDWSSQGGTYKTYARRERGLLFSMDSFQFVLIQSSSTILPKAANARFAALLVSALVEVSPT